ncbi:MAG: MBL fold metallo-hydrolase [Coriobacteriia bacterium]|nr:MBL fold metallo-hydrolase [Coriobacteriia bacterium]
MKKATIPGGFVPVEVVIQGMLDNNVYLVDDGTAVLVVDPCQDADQIMAAVGERTVGGIMLTHYHSDHTGAAADLRRLTGAPVYATAEDAGYVEVPKGVDGTSVPLHPACPVDVRVADGDVVRVGATDWTVLQTPGHSKGSMCWFAEGADGAGAPILLSGDTLFCGTTGRTDFEGGSDADMRASMERLAKLPHNTLVLPGHMRPTTIAGEAGGAFARWGVAL